MPRCVNFSLSATFHNNDPSKLLFFLVIGTPSYSTKVALHPNEETTQ